MIQQVYGVTYRNIKDGWRKKCAEKMTKSLVFNHVILKKYSKKSEIILNVVKNFFGNDFNIGNHSGLSKSTLNKFVLTPAVETPAASMHSRRN